MDTKKVLKTAAVGVAAGVGLYYGKRLADDGYLSEGNAKRYSVEKCDKNNQSPLQGKTILFLGSSVTYGSAAMGESFANYLAAIDGVYAIKEAVSGTLLVDEPVSGQASYITRMKTINPDIHADAFVCQLSTNDASQKKPLGTISDSVDKDTFDTHTVAGAIEYIIAFARETWHCPIIFYTGTKYDSTEYAAMVHLLHEIAKKWDIGVLDLWNDPEMQSVSERSYRLYMSDPIHPTRAGYKEWWTPKFEGFLTEYLAVN